MDDANDRAPGGGRIARSGLQAVAAVVAIYLLFAVAVMIDELVLETHWIHDHMPPAGQPWVEAALHPVTLLLEALGMID